MRRIQLASGAYVCGSLMATAPDHEFVVMLRGGWSEARWADAIVLRAAHARSKNAVAAAQVDLNEGASLVRPTAPTRTQ
jgi:hypothetical protein